MPRSGEYTYFDKIGEAGRLHATNKPFSDACTSRHFMDLGAFFALLPAPPARILECGCGTGWLSYFLARKGYSVVAQDCCQQAIDLAKESPVFLKDASIDFVCSDFEDLKYRNEFDAVLFYASLHHCEHLDDAMQTAYKALKQDGILMAIEPGSGHKEKAKDSIEQFDLGDRDMPPHLVISTGKRVGFRRGHTYQHPAQLISALYNASPNSRLLRRLWRIPGMRTIFLFANLLWLKRYNGMVWMQK